VKRSYLNGRTGKTVLLIGSEHLEILQWFLTYFLLLFFLLNAMIENIRTWPSMELFYEHMYVRTHAPSLRVFLLC